jgi:hypothetical protein
MRRIWRIAVGAPFLLASSCMPKAAPAPFRELGATAAPLRDAFNADVGKVRIVMLVAPT